MLAQLAGNGDAPHTGLGLWKKEVGTNARLLHPPVERKPYDRQPAYQGPEIAKGANWHL